MVLTRRRLRVLASIAVQYNYPSIYLLFYMEDDLVCSVQNFSLWKSCERLATRQGYCPVIVYPGQAARARAGPSLATQPCVPGPGRSERSTVDCGAQPGTNQRPGGHELTNEKPAVTREGLGRGPAVLQSAE